MFRSTCTLVGALCFSGVAFGQSQSSAPRPESLLPESTIFYVGTDDLDAMAARCKAAPVGKILAEQEVKEFLEKPLAELKKAIDQGLAQAKQHPALAQIDLDPAKLLNGPYGRAFVAVTHVQLPPPEAFDPAAIDVGLVIGLEPRDGAVDVLALIRQVIGALAETEGGGNVKVETVQGDGFAFDRIRAPDGAPPLCFARFGGLSVFSLSERALAELATRTKGGGASLATAPEYSRCVAVAGGPSAGDVVVFCQVGRVVDVIHQVVSLALTMNGENEGRAIADKIFDVSKLAAIGPTYATSAWRDGVAVAVSYVEIDPAAGGLCALANSAPIDRDALRYVPKDALSFSLSHFELAPLWDTVMAGLEQVAPEVHGQAMAQIRELEIQVAGADQAGNPNWDIRRDLVGALAGRMTSITTKGAGSMLGPTGDYVLSIETPKPEGLDKSLKNVFALIGKAINNPINFKEQMHGDVKLQVIDPMSLGPAAMVASSFQITYAIHRGRFWFATSPKAMKKALDVLDAPPAENITAKPDFATHFIEPPKDAVITGISYGDTAANFESAYQMILGALNTMMMMQGGAEELPIDMSLLPTAEVISKHLFGTVDVSYRVGKSGHVTISRGPFGPETAVAVASGIAAVAGGAAMLTGRRVRGEMTGAEVRPVPSDPSDQARRDLAEVNTAITVYMIEYGKPPAQLAELVDPKPEYPKGLLNGAPLPTDPWGHGYAYKTDGKESYTVWSFGPNGIDDSGAGDDVIQRS